MTSYLPKSFLQPQRSPLSSSKLLSIQENLPRDSKPDQLSYRLGPHFWFSGTALTMFHCQVLNAGLLS